MDTRSTQNVNTFWARRKKKKKQKQSGRLKMLKGKFQISHNFLEPFNIPIQFSWVPSLEVQKRA